MKKLIIKEMQEKLNKFLMNESGWNDSEDDNYDYDGAGDRNVAHLDSTDIKTMFANINIKIDPNKISHVWVEYTYDMGSPTPSQHEYATNLKIDDFGVEFVKDNKDDVDDTISIKELIDKNFIKALYTHYNNDDDEIVIGLNKRT